VPKEVRASDPEFWMPKKPTAHKPMTVPPKTTTQP